MDIAMTSGPPTQSLKKRLNLFERYLTIWVALGRSVPGLIQWLPRGNSGRAVM